MLFLYRHYDKIMIRAMPTDKILLQIFALWCLLAAFDSYRPLSRPILDVSRHRILMSETVNTIGSTLSKDVTDTNKSMNSDESTQVALERLNVEREKKRIEFIAADLAVKKFTKEAAVGLYFQYSYQYVIRLSLCHYRNRIKVF